MGEVSAERPNNGNTPPWYVTLRSKYLTGTNHIFGLSGATNDYPVVSYQLPLSHYLAKELDRSFQITLFYSTFRGVRFGDEMVEAIRLARLRAYWQAEHATRGKGEFDPTKDYTETYGQPPTMRQQFGKVLGLEDEKKPKGGNAMEDALKSLQKERGQGDGTAEDLGSSPADVLPKIDQAMRKTQRLAVVIERVDLIAPAGEMSQKSPAERNALALLESWGNDPQIIDSGCMLIVIAPSQVDVHADLRTASCRYYWIPIELPTEESRRNYLGYVVDRLQDDENVKAGRDLRIGDGLTLDMLAAMTSGLMKSAIEDVLLGAQAMPDRTLTRALVKERKAQIIGQEYKDVVELLDNDLGLDAVGGHARIKEWLRENVIWLIQNGQREAVPTGMLFMGPPGTGKSFICTALAKESGFNCLKLNPDKIYSRYVGDAERNLAKFLDCASALAPCFVFVDEVDQKVSRGDGGSQVYSNIFGMLLEAISKPKNRGNIVFVAATNRPDLIDPALVRAGRLGVKIPFLPPDDGERKDVFDTILRTRYGSDLDVTADFVTATDGWTQSEINELITNARSRSLRRRETLGLAHLSAEMADMRRDSKDYDEYTRMALKFTSNLSLLPTKYRRLLEMDNLPKPVATEPPPPADGIRPTRRL